MLYTVRKVAIALALGHQHGLVLKQPFNALDVIYPLRAVFLVHVPAEQVILEKINKTL